MKFFHKNARFIVPLPFLFLALIKAWYATYGGDKSQILASLGFSGIALLSYFGQKQIHLARQERPSDGIGRS